MAKLRKSKGKAKPAEGAKPEVENAAAAPLQASTSNSTPASIKKKIKKKDKVTKIKSEIPETEIAVAEEANTPAEAPEKVPAEAPAKLPTEVPSNAPTEVPSNAPIEVPSNALTEVPSNTLTEVPSNALTEAPSNALTEAPSNALTEAPSNALTEVPSNAMTEVPSNAMTEVPSSVPTEVPSNAPTEVPSNALTEALSNTLNEAPENAEKSSGFIFMCNSRSKPECFRHQVFGLPRGKAELVERIKPGARLFLYDIDLRLLYGIYSAVSAGGINLAPEAFGGAFPAQVIFKIDKDCIPLPERSFKQAILENYGAKNRFEQNLSSKQVHSLVLLFQPAAHMPPPEDPYRSGGHLASAHMPPPKDQYRSAGQLAVSHLPLPEDPYRTAGHMVQPHLPPPVDPYRSVGHVASYLHPAVAYRSGSYLMHHQLPPEDPYRHAYLPRVPIDPRYLSPFAPPPANDPRAPQHYLAAPPPTDPYYPAPANPYGQVDARAYYPENPALSDRFGYRMMAPATLAATDPSLQQRYYMQSSDDANRSYMENIQRQAMNNATAAPTGPVSSLYPFPGAAPAHR